KVLKEYFEKHRDSLCEDCQRRIDTNPLRILDCKVDRDSEVLNNVPKIDDYLSDDSKEYFTRVLAYLKEMDIPFRIDQKLVRGLDYYTDTVFEIVSTNSESGAQSTIIGGGRYDNLVEYFDAPPTSGIGFAMGLERLIILADAEGVLEVPEDKCDVYLIDLTGGDPRVVSLALKLRNEGFVTELNVYNRKLKAQFKSAERYSARNIIIVGEDELSNQTVNVKNSESKDQKTIPMASLINYLKEN
ncbi:MAG: histidine--tRNA ligase, partial [Erysipelotrichaceae bacterium]|nr:histidine--tRNA ligase [Erysipelotrichaceae bacterium]